MKAIIVFEIIRKNNIITTKENGVVISKEVIEDNKKAKLQTSDKSVRSYSAWSLGATKKSSRSGNFTLLSTGISIIATISGLKPAASIVIAIASAAASFKLKNIYYISKTYYRYDKSKEKIQGKIYTKFYKYSNYTGYMNSTTHYFYTLWD